MKQILVTGLLLLGVVLGLNAAAIIRPLHEDVSTDQRVGRSNSVRVFSCGWQLEPARFVVGRTPIALIIDGESHTGGQREAGLWVIAIDRGRVGEVHTFELAKSNEAIDSFGDFCEQTQPGTILAMGVLHIGAPRLDDRNGDRDQLDAIYRGLGAQAPPTVTPTASWAYLCVRGEEGWNPIAEVQSATRGVSLARLLSADPEQLSAVPATFIIDTSKDISLIQWFDRASYVTEGFTRLRLPENSVSGGPLDSIYAHPPFGEAVKSLGHNDHRIAWDNFLIPERAVFKAQLGISSWARENSDGVVYHVVVDGEEVATRTIGSHPPDPATWVSWEVDLSQFGGQAVRFELRVSVNGTPYSDQSVWGDPKIVYPAVP